MKKPPRNNFVVAMNARNKTQIFADRREPRGGDRNEQKELLDEVAMEAMDIDDECVMTLEKTIAALEKIEAQIAAKLNLSGSDIRAQLLQLDKNNLLVEDDLVADWHCLYATYVNW